MAQLPTTTTKLFAVLNKNLTDNNKPTINPADFSSFNPVPYAGLRSQRNTLLELDPPLTSPSVGRTGVFYDRIPFATVTGLNVEKGSATTLLELLPALNNSIGINLTIADFEPATLPASGSMSVTASATNLLYTGTLTFTLVV